MPASTPSSSSSQKQRADAMRAKARDAYIRFGTTVSRELDPSYMQTVGSFPRLTPEEEVTYAKQFQEGRQALQDTLRKWPALLLFQLRVIAADSELRPGAFLEAQGQDDPDDEEVSVSVSSLLNDALAKLESFPSPAADNPSPLPASKNFSNDFWAAMAPLRFRDAFYDDCLKIIADDTQRKLFIDDEEWSTVEPTLTKICNSIWEAKKILVERNLRLVISIASNFLGGGMPLADLVQEGNLGLIRAVEKFDYQRGHRFGTYASYWIRQAVTQHITNHGRIIRMPANTIQQISQINRTEQELLQKTGAIPTAEDIAAVLNLSPARVRALQKMSLQPLSLHIIMNNEDSTLEDMIADTVTPNPREAARQKGLQDSIKMALDNLDERERTIITLRFGLYGTECHTLAQLSQILQLTSERIRQIEAAAIQKLRQPDNLKFFDGYN
ncbi:MAG: sigma-70 family RNA polymerase sigma factor [Lentisphaerae bacterium]|jgi:RNA polymerase primary sigma factor|nr:sigma-70 family RNA polymerase sigma factor [Lentisphaerota bacterium]